MKITDMEKSVLRASLAESRCRCKVFLCPHLVALWNAGDRLGAATRRSYKRKESPNAR